MKQSASYGAVNAAPYTRCKLDRTLATMARMGVLFKKNTNSTCLRRGWRRGAIVSAVRRMNEVNPRRTRLVLGWVTVFWRVNHLSM